MQLSTALNLPNRQVSVGGFGYGASLALDFTSGNQTLDPRITFTRSTTATFTGSDGLIQTAAINAPRFDYNPVTLAPKGLLIEEQRTNLVTYSEQFDNAAWAKTRCSITANTIVAPDGALTADKLVEDATASDTHLLTQSISFTSGTAYTYSIFAKQAEAGRFFQLLFPSAAFGSALRATFDLTNGTFQVSASITGAITFVGNGWYRCSITGTATTTASASIGILLANSSAATGAAAIYTGNGYSGIYIWGAQLEAGAFATSYIPTVASQVTRAADSAVMTGTNFSSWFNQAEGTMFADYLLSDPNSHSVAEISSGGSDYIRMRYSSGAAAQYTVQVAGVSQASQAPTGFSTPNTQYRRAITYATNSFNQAINGLLPTAEDTSGTVPVSTRLFIGAEGATGAASFLGGTIKKLAYYPRRLSDAELQGITS